MSNQTSLNNIRGTGGALAAQPSAQVVEQDFAVDMFTERGFTLANRIARAYASSDAVPAQFRMWQVKRVKRGDDFQDERVENTAAIANCLVAIEVARAVQMSITAVMQNADMIEGKLRWSGKFVIAAINASGRFSPLRFQLKNLGPIKATYREKKAWNREKKGYDFDEKEVEVDNIECIAWALPRGTPEPRPTAADLREYAGRQLDLYRALGVPVVESAPVTMKMVVEEGWYSKPGSKWQTEMRALMFQYRAGSFFGNIHAPDIVMGMGRTSEEERDMTTVDVAPDGTVVGVFEGDRVTVPRDPVPLAEVVGEASGTAPTPAPAPTPAAAPATAAARANQDTGEIDPPPAGQAQPQGDLLGDFDPEAFKVQLRAAKNIDSLQLLADQMRTIQCTDAVYEAMVEVYNTRLAQLEGGNDLPAEKGSAADPQARAAAAQADQQQGQPPTRRRSSGSGNNRVD